MGIHENKKAFITGSSRGIGRALALELAGQGIDILLHYRRDKEAALATQAAIEKKGVRVWVYQADLCDAEETEKMLAQICKEHETLDYYVANAASTAFKAVLDLTPANIEKTFQLVVKSFVVSVNRLKPLLQGRDSQVLAISGIDTVKYCPGHGLLAAAKSALETLVKYLGVELASDKIHVKCINPGLVATDSTRFYLGDAFAEVCEKANKIVPQGGYTSPEKLAKILALVLKNEMDWLCSQTLYMDGGLSFLLPFL